MCLGWVWVIAWIGVLQERKLAAAVLARRETDRIRDQYKRQYDQLHALGQALSKQLDRQSLLQTMIEAASRMSSVGQANSLASLWMLDFEKDTFRFDRGLYCDHGMFTKTVVQPSDAAQLDAVFPGDLHAEGGRVGGRQGSDRVSQAGHDRPARRRQIVDRRAAGG
jgi:hypothetical protein